MRHVAMRVRPGEKGAIALMNEHVQDRIVERRKVRSAGRRFERNVVRDDRNGVGRVRADKGVQVGIVSHRILTGFFRASRIALVTPLRDGMNLVAKEYIAAQNAADPGVLVLSCFAGAFG